MKFLRRSFMSRVLSTVTVLGAALTLASTAQAQAPLRIGSTLALTGPLSSTALTHKLVGEIYVEQINAKGGILGRKLEWIVKDDQS
jgi:branched-chain amino acid transport system substrate-binding protein